ncbi:hypothetical protein HID58_081551, partial [Brassica napus]
AIQQKKRHLMSKTCSNPNKEYPRVAHASIAFTVSQINAGEQRTTHRKSHLPPESSRNHETLLSFSTSIFSTEPNKIKASSAKHVPWALESINRLEPRSHPNPYFSS